MTFIVIIAETGLLLAEFHTTGFCGTVTVGATDMCAVILAALSGPHWLSCHPALLLSLCQTGDRATPGCGDVSG